jgi:hypothetical protein
MSEIKALTEKIKRFRDERDWMQFHNHKDVALSLVEAGHGIPCKVPGSYLPNGASDEAVEVLEHFQWKKPEEVEAHGNACKDEIADELADVFFTDKDGKEQYLNNLLLQEGLAVRVRD